MTLTVVEYTLQEGGEWYSCEIAVELHADTPLVPPKLATAFALKFSDGRVWDPIVGWRKSIFSELQEWQEKAQTAFGIPVHAVGDRTIKAGSIVRQEIENAIEEAVRAPRQFPIYVASKIQHAGMWKHYRRLWGSHNIRINSSWIDYILDDHRTTPLAFAGAWITNIREITEAKAVICYGDGKDILRGALVEAGVAIGQHKPVIIVDREEPTSSSPRWGSWQYHPLVHYAATLEDALSVLKRWTSLGTPQEEGARP